MTHIKRLILGLGLLGAIGACVDATTRRPTTSETEQGLCVPAGCDEYGCWGQQGDCGSSGGSSGGGGAGGGGGGGGPTPTDNCVILSQHRDSLAFSLFPDTRVVEQGMRCQEPAEAWGTYETDANPFGEFIVDCDSHYGCTSAFP